MTADGDIWRRLADSGLVSGAQVASIRTEFEHDQTPPTGDRSPAGDVLRWLARENRISDYQRAVLASGQSGPFQFEDYLVHGRIESGPLAATFRARHVPTGHPVRLFFYGGETIDDARNWHHAESLTRSWQTLDHRLVWRLHESVTTGCWRFVVTTAGNGKTMQEKIPRRGRLPWPQACQALQQLAHGLQAIDAQNLSHGKLSPDYVWIQKSGICQIIPPLPLPAALSNPDSGDEAENGGTPGEQPSPQDSARRYLTPRSRKSLPNSPDVRDDLFALGQIGIRLIAGRIKTMRESTMEDRLVELQALQPVWKKYEIPEPLQALLTGLLSADVSPQPPSVSTVVAMLQNIVGSQSTIEDADPDPPSTEAFVDVMEQQNRSSRFFDELESRMDRSGKPVATGASQSAVKLDLNSLESNQPGIPVAQRVVRRRHAATNRSRVPWIAGVLILLVAVVTGVWLGGFDRDPAPAESKKQSPPAAINPDDSDSGETDSGETDLPDAGPQPDAGGASTQPPGNAVIVATSPWLEQTVDVADDTLAWESPTAGAPINGYWLPPAPEFIFAWRPQQVLANPATQNWVQAAGPGIQPLLKRWLELTGIPLDQIGLMTISLHASAGRYDVLVNAELADAADQSQLLSVMPEMSELDQPAPGTRLLESDTVRICLVEPADQPGQVERVMLGSGETLSDLFSGGGLAACDRRLARLIERSDQDRDLTLLFLNSSLLSEEGAWLFSGAAAELRRPLQLFFDDRVRAVLISAHADRGNYLELMTQQTLDLPDDEAAVELQNRLRTAGDKLLQHIRQRPAHPYWKPLQQRITSMVPAIIDNTRTTTESDGVIANCWLPPAALQNLVAFAELSLADPRFERGSETTVPSGPQTLAELLATPRSLDLTNSPDLRVLLDDLQKEITDDFPDLPFEFTIRILGDDLQQQGITQNQRPGDITVSQKPLAEILTTIMFQANPDKDATGPDDVRCKLVWVAAADPDQPDHTIIQITTRQAAAAKNLELPTAFQSE